MIGNDNSGAFFRQLFPMAYIEAQNDHDDDANNDGIKEEAEEFVYIFHDLEKDLEISVVNKVEE